MRHRILNVVNTPTSGQILEVLPQESGAQRVLVIQRKDMGLAHRIHLEEMRYRLERFQPAQIGHGQRHHMFGLSMTSSGSGSRGRLRSPNALLNWTEKR